MTWTEWGILLLVGERGLRILYQMGRGGFAAYRALSRTPDQESAPWMAARLSTTRTGFPSTVEIASDDAVALDYSSGTKRH